MKKNWKSYVGVALAVTMTAGATVTPLRPMAVFAEASVVSSQEYGGPVIGEGGQVTFYYQGDGTETKVRVKGSWSASWDVYYDMKKGEGNLWSVTTTGLEKGKSYQYGIEVLKSGETKYTWVGDTENPCTTGNSQILRNPQINEDGSVKLYYYPERGSVSEVTVKYRPAGSEEDWTTVSMTNDAENTSLLSAKISAADGTYEYQLIKDGAEIADVSAADQQTFTVSSVPAKDPSVKSPVVNENEVSFYYYGPLNKSVQLAGSMTEWGAAPIDMTYDAETGYWSTTQTLEDGSYEYKFIVDGNWITDPLNNNTANTNSALEVGTPAVDVSGSKVTDLVQVQIGEQLLDMQLYNGKVYECFAEVLAGTTELSLLKNGEVQEESATVLELEEAQTVYIRLQNGKLTTSVDNQGVGKEFHTAALVGSWASAGVVFQEGEDTFSSAWTPADEKSELNYVGGGIYSRTFRLAAPLEADTEVEYKVAFDDTWDGGHSLGETRDGANITVTLPAGTEVFTVWVDDLNSIVYDSVRTPDFTVAQMNSELKFPALVTRISLIGSLNEWDTTAEGYDFTQISDRYYLYQRTMPAGSVMYKVLFDGTYYYEKEGNQEFTLTEDTHVIFVYDAEEGYVYDTVNDNAKVAQILGFEAEPAKADVKDNANGTTTFVMAGVEDAKTVKLVYAPKADPDKKTTVAMKKSANGDGSFRAENLFLGDDPLDYLYYYEVDGIRTIVDALETEVAGEETYNHYVRDAFEGRPVYIPGTLPGESWNPAVNQMEYKGNGLYQYTFKDVPAANYEYKIAMGSWAENYGMDGGKDGANIPITVTEKTDITISYNDFSHRSVNSLNYIFADVTLTGTGVPADTKLQDTSLTGIYSVTIPMEEGTYDDYKLLCDGTEYPFASFEVKTAKDVSFFFDPTTEIYYCDASDEKVDTDPIYYDTRDTNYKSVYGAIRQGEEVTFSIDTGMDADKVMVIFKDNKSRKVELKKDSAQDGVQRWSTTTAFDEMGTYTYYFVIYSGNNVAIYSDDDGNYGSGKAGDLSGVIPYDLVVYDKDFETPDWMKEGIIYQIFPDRFFNGDTSNDLAQMTSRGATDYEYIKEWYTWPENPEQETLNPEEYPENAFVGDGNWSNEIYGGDLKGITERVEYLKALGVSVIYLNPVFHSISSHRYDATDYTKIDPVLGDLGDFTELVEVAEANDMHIVLDGVFNHVSDDSIYFDRYYKFLGQDEHVGAYPYWAYVYDYMDEQGKTQEEAEKAAKSFFKENYGITDFTYTQWFDVFQDQVLLDDDGEEVVDTIGGRAGKTVYGYDGWWGYDSMPVIKSTDGSEYQTPGWAEEIISGEDSVGQYWLSQGSDGWRLDVANEVSDETWQRFRESVKSLDSDHVIIGEIWTDATKYLMGDMYDSVMNYVFRNAVLSFAKGGSAEESTTALERIRERYPEEAFYAMMNLVGSHDTTRLLSYLDGIDDDRNQKDVASAFPTYEATSDLAKQRQYLVALTQMTYPGAPTIYYGDEIGMVGADDPDDRRAMEWGKGSKDLVEWYAKLGAIRNAYPVLRTGGIEPFTVMDGTVADDHLMGYLRTMNDEFACVVLNNASENVVRKLEIPEGTAKVTDVISGKEYTVGADGTCEVTVPALRGVVMMPSENVKEVTVDYEALKPAYDSSYIVEDSDVVLVKDIFKDLQGGEWFESYVQYVYDHGYMTGMNAERFAPEAKLERAQFATILYRMENEPDVEFKNIYEDVADGEYYSDAVIWASSEGVNIITGYGAGPDKGKFGSADPITREQLATMLYRYARYKGYDISKVSPMEDFQDKDNVSEFAKEAMGWAVANGLMTGNNGKLNPQNNTTRAECATIIQRFMSNVK